ncbi:hypothetical protein KDE13_08445 [Campylobacter sp. faydin G-140]|uniref:hypothetical protein n=1 Tax=Campylobacter anatolicus TaxID=2829105 RepID=UPI001B9A7578|nr:hypothetical protein [Campylobacter anatolicus]MBR8466361.1 hypothetical protein [Campylobacter anatolicus]
MHVGIKSERIGEILGALGHIAMSEDFYGKEAIVDLIIYAVSYHVQERSEHGIENSLKCREMKSQIDLEQLVRQMSCKGR